MMTLRPADEHGDILPVLSARDLLMGPAAVALLAEERLNLYTGDWWENPEWGNGILDLLRDARPTEKDLQAIAAALTDYLRETPGVREVRDAACVLNGRQIRYTCTLGTDGGQAEVAYLPGTI